MTLISRLTRKKPIRLWRKFANAPSEAISELNILSLMAVLLRPFLIGSGVNTEASILTGITFISALQLWEITTANGSTSKEIKMKELKLMAESWGKTFLATALATYLAVGWDLDAIANAALVSVLPSIINWLNPNYERYGKVK